MDFITDFYLVKVSYKRNNKVGNKSQYPIHVSSIKQQHFDSNDCYSENKVKISAVKPNHQSVLRNCDLTLRLQEHGANYQSTYDRPRTIVRCERTPTFVQQFDLRLESSNIYDDSLLNSGLYIECHWVKYVESLKRI